MVPLHRSALPSTLAPPSAGAPPAFPAGGGDVTLVPSSGSGQQQLAISNGVLLAAVIFLFMVVVFVFLLYLYAKRYLGANPLLAPASPSSSRFIFVAASPLPQRGLPAAVLRSLPVTVYEAAKESEPEALECAVCLSEVAGGEKVRALPKCGHGFHVECIDMWFHSHDTCPLCRAPVGGAGLDALPREDPAAAAAEFPAAFPTNVLFWGTHGDVANSDLSVVPPPAQTAGPSSSSSSAGAAARGRKENLVIDIPTRAVGPLRMTSPLPASRMPGFSAEEVRSPVSARLRSLRRLLSRGKQAVVGTSSYSPRAAAGDIEQGLPSADPAARPPPPPKTPKTPPAGN
ncbi:hypothetical protein U9M48_029482 [Paspalum notatum var. saurae]|uniref:RING-type E3 ubiquitin transferase n=1 Tax=Paspalum notatum var. saurae TaxID=547442 RepID=A0AAQ3U121_PASNO